MSLIILNEAPEVSFCVSRHSDICDQDTMPFEGKLMIFAGDFKQIFAIVIESR